MSAKDFVIAIERDDLEELEILIQYSACAINEEFQGLTPLWHAIKRQTPIVSLIERLLQAGADPNLPNFTESIACDSVGAQAVKAVRDMYAFIHHFPQLPYSQFSSPPEFFVQNVDAPLNFSMNKEYADISSLLIEYGANLATLSRSEQRAVISLRFGDSIFAMFERAQYEFDRFGSSITILQDGCWLMIGGLQANAPGRLKKIFNDVAVIMPNGVFKVVNYPESEFAPICFHSATLIDDSVILIDYASPAPRVFRLDLTTLQICRLRTSGDAPIAIHYAKARLCEDGRLLIWGSSAIPEWETLFPDLLYTFDPNSLVWCRVSSPTQST